MSVDDFKSLKKLGKDMSKAPTEAMMQSWKKTPFKVQTLRPPQRRSQWLQLVAALLAGILIGKYVWQSSSDIFSTQVANNIVEDETFEYVYTNN